MITEVSTPRRRVKVAEAAAYVGLSVSHLNKLRLPENKDRGPPWYALGRAVVYDTADLDAWLAARRRQSTAGPR